jgi:hypothetical protein
MGPAMYDQVAVAVGLMCDQAIVTAEQTSARHRMRAPGQ